DREPLPYVLAIEGARQLSRLHRPLALVQHLHVAAEWDRGEDPFRAVRPDPSHEERAAKAHGKTQDLHAAKPGDEVMTILVHDDQHAERDEEGEDGLQEAHAARPSMRSTRCAATRRASASAASTVSRSSAAAGRVAPSVS